MTRIVKKDGFIFIVDGEVGRETWMNLGKDIEDPRWADEVAQMEFIKKEVDKPKKIKKSKKQD